MRDRVGPFVLGHPLGRGGMGEVWQARHETLGIEVAVKTLTASRARSEKALDSFRREVHAVARLDHPSVIAVHDHGVVGDGAPGLGVGHPYLVMERADRSLADAPPRRFAEVRRLLLALLDALAHAHARGVIHRDLKPANVLAIGARWVLADFGLAHALEAGRARRSDRVSGTPAYMAPEQGRGDERSQGPWTDLYALGCLAFELVEGRVPFEATSALSMLVAHMTEPPPPLTGARVASPPGFEAWVHGLLVKHPYERVPRAADAAHALAALHEPLDETAAPSAGEGADTLCETDLPTLWEVAGAPVRLPVPAARSSAPPPLPELAARAVDPWRRRLPGVGLGLFGLREIPMVGRDAEREVLFDALRRARASGRPVAVIVEGPSGAGKTRLGQWLVERAHELGAANVLRAGHEPHGGPGHGLAPALARELRVDGLEAAAVVDRALEQGWSADFVEDACRLLGEDVATDDHRERVALMVRMLTEMARRERPLVAFLDDVQWGEEALLVAEEMIARAGAAVLLVLGVQVEAVAERAVERGRLDALAAHPAVHRIALAPPERDDHRELVDAMLGLDDALRELVVERTLGNPFFAVQLVGDWVRRGILAPTEAGFALVEGAHVDLPDDVHTLLVGRLADLWERLPAADRAPARLALEAAAVLGRTVDDREWAGTLRTLGAGVPSELVHRLEEQRLASRVDATSWRFAHEMLRESVARAAHEGGRASALHGAAAAMLEGQRPSAWRARERAGRHLLEAGRPREAIARLLDAAYGAMPAAEIPRARELIDLAERTLAGLDLPATDPDARRLALLRGRLEVYVGAYEEALARLESAPLDGLDALWRARALYLTAFVLLRLERPARVVSMLEESLVLAREAGDGYAIGQAEHGLGDAALLGGDPEAAAARYRRAAKQFEEEGLRLSVGHAYNGLASALTRAGRVEEGMAARERALGIHRERGDHYGVACVSWDAGDALLTLGRPDEAVPWFEQSAAAFRRIDSQRVFLALVSEVRARRAAGDPRAAERAADVIAELRAADLDADADALLA